MLWRGAKERKRRGGRTDSSTDSPEGLRRNLQAPNVSLYKSFLLSCPD